MVKNNQRIYSDRSIVNYYLQLNNLQSAEITILHYLQDKLKSMKMLDLGIGGGRTTQYFAPLVAEYIGIDYSPNMIEASQRRFPNLTGNITLEVGDVRDLSRYSDSYFDFILFSFNGLDYISHSDRIQALQEIHRVTKPNGFFCFSTHNLQGIESHFDWQQQLSFNPFAIYVNLVMYLILRLVNLSYNRKKLSQSDSAIIKDEPHNFRLATYYIRPLTQLQQLEPYFYNTKIFLWHNGQEIKTRSELLNNKDMWLYYLTINKS